MMRFARPDILWAMAIVLPLLIGFLWWTWRERQKLIAQFVQARLLSVLTVGVSKPRQKLRLVLLASAVAITLIALSRPQWGFGYQEVKQRGLDIVIGIDTSRSMLAEDVPPNRLQKAKLAAQDLRQLAKSDRMGLVAFAGSAFLQMPMSLDENAFRQHLEALDTRLLPQGGTALAEAIQTARSAFKEAGEENHRALVLFTDGEDHDGQAIEAAAQAAKEGMVVFTIGLGSANGELIPVRDAKGRVDFIKDENGNAVKSRLNESLLQDIAKAGKGFYLHLTGPGAMEMLYERGLAPLPKRDLQATLMRSYFERFQWFLAAACLLLVTEMFVVDFKTPPRRRGTTSPATTTSLPTAGITAILLLCAGIGHASPSSARREYDSGKFKNALNEYESLLEKKPKDAALQYNAGAAAFQAGKLQDAADHFGSALATQDAQLQQRAYYNLGNTRFRLGEDAGDPTKTQKLWEQSISDFETALKLNPQDSDAQHNLNWVKERLEELKKQQQEQKKDSDSQDKDEKKDQQDKDKDKKDSKESKDSKNDQKQNQEQDKDKSSQDKKDQEKSKEDSAQDKKSSEQEKKDSQQQDSKKDDQQEGKEEQKSAQDERDKQDGAQNKPGQSGTTNNPSATQPQGGAPMSSQPMQMSQREAIRLLEALRSEEKLFLPPPPQQPRKSQRRLKDW